MYLRLYWKEIVKMYENGRYYCYDMERFCSVIFILFILKGMVVYNRLNKI